MNSIRAAAFVALALGACNLNNPGFDAPEGALAYPVALALSKDEGGKSKYLYVANSNFNLRYNGASVQSYDLDELQRLLAYNRCIAERADVEPGVDAGEVDAGELDAGVDAGDDLDAGAALDASEDGALADASPDDAALAEGDAGDAQAPDARVDARITGMTLDVPAVVSEASGAPKLCDGRNGEDPNANPCCFVRRSRNEHDHHPQLGNIRLDEVSIDSFASSIALSPDGAHLYVPVRGTSRLLHLIANEDGSLTCGSGQEEGRCKNGPRYGRKAEVDDLTYPALPNAVLTGSFADLGVRGRGEHFVATAHEAGEISLFRITSSGSTDLLYTLNDPNLPVRAVSLRQDQGFLLVSSAAARFVVRVGATTEVPANASREPSEPDAVYLYRAEPLAISDVVFDQDIRDVMPDSRPQQPGKPRRYYALLRGLSSRVTQSIAFVELDANSSDGRLARVVDAVRVGSGLSKIVQADVGDRHLLFASCYQDGEIHVVDADARKTVTVIRDVLGPSDMQIDSARQLLYVTDFSASVIRVVDLRGLFEGGSLTPRVVATLGAPYFPGNIQ